MGKNQKLHILYSKKCQLFCLSKETNLWNSYQSKIQKKKAKRKEHKQKILKSNHTEKISDNKWQKQQKQNEQQEKFRIKYMNI